ncbi:putative integral membrane protein [Aspergillus thermomutatus]|uniref:Rhodopsin domain-containing protein n=1 Tax=Aspergillus thermomutatus TaxID=41047 RepID=A0A397HJ92_ASPTH|nr:uncharacterized protein CDV56_108427 [Aspergillus thermomutatus]RHZ62158.1 hypothetical protein CDV56_108427 [Aspergillus thermomutatus]
MTFGTARGREALSLSIAFTTLATTFTIIRIYTRTFLVKQMGADDWAILVALAFSWAFFGLFVGEVKYLMGEHYLKIPSDIYIKQMKCFWASVPIYQASLLTTKASILLQYKRVFSTPRMRFACWCLIGFLAVYGTWTFISAWLNCIPVSKFWFPDMDGYCLDKKALWFSNSAIHIFTDILILIFPMPVLKNLQLPRRQRFALMGVFALGAFVLITSILRLNSLLVISNSSDPTYDNPGAAMWSAIECNVAIICACLPGIRAFISKLLPRFLSSYKSKSNTHTKTTRSRITHYSNFQASVAGHQPGFHLQSITHGAEGGDDKASGFEEGTSNKIKVTTIVSQESVSNTQEDSSSVLEEKVKRFDVHAKGAVEDRICELRLTGSVPKGFGKRHSGSEWRLCQYALSSSAHFSIFNDIGDMYEQVSKNQITPGLYYRQKDESSIRWFSEDDI